MNAVVQRVTQSTVLVDGETIGSIEKGVLVLLGVSKTDSEKEAAYLAGKIANLRIFEDDDGKMNRSLLDINGSILVVSQFTLLGDCRKGRRPSFISAAPPEQARELYEYFIRQCKHEGLDTQTGRFQAMMQVSLVNDGPVTLILESPESLTAINDDSP
ncbi:MAG: D-tyrosyl-tRNA(Tyr) deacylase [Desulfobacteraceae bacterium]|nr:D-tyrosyl-tRNA(Tyr) deacylase [Desulfobacteraceae bacterium]